MANLVMRRTQCPFCDLQEPQITVEGGSAVAILDAFPVSEGHTLVVPRRHVASVFDLTVEEQAAIWKLVSEVKSKLTSELQPDGFNVGINDGPAAGQTVMHAHIHIIPRRIGDVVDPRGGVRWIIPDKAAYWTRGQK